MQDMLTPLYNIHQGKGKTSERFLKVKVFRDLCLINDRYSKLAFLHLIKERKTLSLSTQASFAPISLKVAWSGKSLIPVTPSLWVVRGDVKIIILAKFTNVSNDCWQIIGNG